MNEVKTSMDEIAEGSAVKLPSFAERLTAIFVEPKIVFDFIAHRTDFWLSFVGLVVLFSINGVLSLPTSIKMQELMLAAKGASSASKGITPMSYVLVPLQQGLNLLVMLVVMAAVIWLIVVFVSGGTSYAKAINVACWATYPTGLMMIVNGIIVAVTRPEITSIQTSVLEMNPVMHYTSLAALAPPGNMMVTMMLTSLSLFSVWYFWLLYIGVRRSLGGTATAAIVLILVSLAFQAGLSALSAWGLSKAAGL
jgi:hypothetical protein